MMLYLDEQTIFSNHKESNLMTLNTTIYILDPVNPHDVFNFGNFLLGNGENVYRPGGSLGNVRYSEVKNSEWSEPGVVNIYNNIGQGFPAILDCSYREDAPLWEEDTYDVEDLSEYGGGISSYLISPACYMSLSFDTGYGYRDDLGGASNLHARYLVDLYKWLQKKNVRIRWQNEFTGEIHDGIDGLDKFFVGGDKAESWFENEVMPLMSIGMPPKSK